MSESVVEGDGFRHLVFQRMESPPNDRLHVYIEGDGLPWVNNRPNTDPTPQLALALSLASKDSGDVAYIGRPCYFGVQESGDCSPRYWTSHRYSAEVIRSMAATIARVRKPEHVAVVLIGYSGGGAIAALLEPHVDNVVAVVTVVANLDIDRWAQHHDYDPLHGSLNPVQQRTDPDIPKYQLVGRSDDNVPLKTVAHYGDDRSNVDLQVYDGFDHVCCWENEWPDFLTNLRFALRGDEERDGSYD